MIKKHAHILIALTIATFAFPKQTVAHVTLEPKSASAGSYSKLVFRVPHGCEGSPTTEITVKLPAGILSVKPQIHPGWKISTKKIKLEKPAELHGKPITETISEVAWSGGRIPDEFMDEFGMSVKLPEKSEGKLVFPVIQKCAKGSANWEEVTTSEHAGHTKFPAPFLILNSATEHSGH
jgi:periplasmic copper chaperone A